MSKNKHSPVPRRRESEADSGIRGSESTKEPMSSRPDAELLLSMAHDAISRRDPRLAQSILASAIAIEESEGRGGSPIALQARRQSARVCLIMGQHGHARFHADRLLFLSPDQANRRAARRLIARADKMNAERAASEGTHAWRGVGYALYQPEPFESKLTFADVGGLEPVKQQIYRAGILPLLNADRAKHYGIEPGGAILLTGPPGCGKTLVAQAAAGEMGAPLFIVKAADIMHPLLGMQERNLAIAFDAVRKLPRSVLFFDELDGIAPERKDGMVEGRRSLVNCMLTEMDGAVRNGGCLVIATTNAVDLIDPALRRRGRFDKVIHVGAPDIAARQAILAIKLADRPLAEDVDVPLLADLSAGLTGADIEGVVKDAVEEVWSQAVLDGIERDVEMTDLLIALSRGVRDGTLRGRIEAMISDGWMRCIDGGVGYPDEGATA